MNRSHAVFEQNLDTGLARGGFQWPDQACSRPDFGVIWIGGLAGMDHRPIGNVDLCMVRGTETAPASQATIAAGMPVAPEPITTTSASRSQWDGACCGLFTVMTSHKLAPREYPKQLTAAPVLCHFRVEWDREELPHGRFCYHSPAHA